MGGGVVTSLSAKKSPAEKKMEENKGREHQFVAS